MEELEVLNCILLGLAVIFFEQLDGISTQELQWLLWKDTSGWRKSALEEDAALVPKYSSGACWRAQRSSQSTGLFSRKQRRLQVSVGESGGSTESKALALRFFQSRAAQQAAFLCSLPVWTAEAMNAGAKARCWERDSWQAVLHKRT